MLYATGCHSFFFSAAKYNQFYPCIFLFTLLPKVPVLSRNVKVVMKLRIRYLGGHQFSEIPNYNKGYVTE